MFFVSKITSLDFFNYQFSSVNCRKFAGLPEGRRGAELEAASAGGHGSAGEFMPNKLRFAKERAELTLEHLFLCTDCSWNGIH